MIVVVRITANIRMRIPGLPNSANPQWLAGFPRLLEYPPVASKERPADAVSSEPTRTCHVRIPRLEPFPQTQPSHSPPTARSYDERCNGQKTETARCCRDSCTIPSLALQGHTHPQRSPCGCALHVLHPWLGEPYVSSCNR